MQDVLHLKAPGNWINDPNGFIYYRGEYHLFYQHFPYDTQWGTMHWGHAVSKDLIHWEHQKIAMLPSKGFDRNGCFSGTAIEKDGSLYLFYTAVAYDKLNEDNIHVIVDDQFESSQAILVSPDGITFDNFSAKRQIIPPIEDIELGHRTHTRDPKVWEYDGKYYMLLGTKTEENVGKLLFYTSDNLMDWKYFNSYTKPGLGYMWECPDLFRIGEDDVLLMSPEGVRTEGPLYTSQSICSVVSFDVASCELEIPESYQMVDYGLDLYAPQTNVDADGRRVMIGWMRMPKKVSPAEGEPWIGMMALPRVIEIEQGHIYFRVHPNVEKSFTNRVTDISKVDWTQPFQIQTTLQSQDMLNIGGYRVEILDDALITDRSEVFDGLNGYDLQLRTPKLSGKYELNIFVEPNLIEIFVNNGEYVLSNIVYNLNGHIQSTAELKIKAP